MRLYLRLAAARLRGQTHYRASFALQVASTFVGAFTQLLAVLLFFRTFTDLGGWSVGEVAFLYGLASIAFGLVELFGGAFEDLSPMIREGEFDRILTRPISPFVQVLAADLQLRRLGRIAQGVVALGVAQALAGIAWVPVKVLLALLALGSTAIVFFTAFLIGAAICFWAVESSEVQNIFTYGGTELASNPIHVYHPVMRGIFLYLMPLGFTSYYPAVYILGKPDPLGLPPIAPFLAPVVAALFLALGLRIWSVGLRHYQSTGS